MKNGVNAAAKAGQDWAKVADLFNINYKRAWRWTHGDDPEETRGSHGGWRYQTEHVEFLLELLSEDGQLTLVAMADVLLPAHPRPRD